VLVVGAAALDVRAQATPSQKLRAIEHRADFGATYAALGLAQHPAGEVASVRAESP
jgi:hypothetical protein